MDDHVGACRSSECSDLADCVRICNLCSCLDGLAAKTSSCTDKNALQNVHRAEEIRYDIICCDECDTFNIRSYMDVIWTSRRCQLFKCMYGMHFVVLLIFAICPEAPKSSTLGAPCCHWLTRG